jgi:hypothetical protein
MKAVSNTNKQGRWFTWMCRKLLTKPLWLWETQRSYPIRERVFQLPPLVSDDGAAVTLAVLTTPRTVNNAAWALYSLRKSLTSQVALHLIVDGILSPFRVGQLKALFPGLRITTTGQHLASLADQVPSLDRLAETHPMAGKMATVLDLQELGHLVFSDDDVLAFKPLSEINASIAEQPPTALYLREQAASSVQEEPSIKAGIQKLGLNWLRDINVGLMWIPKGSLDTRLCERILQASPTVQTWFPDTMLLAALLHQVPSQALPDSYVVSTQRQFFHEQDVDYDNITLRHFISPVRHLMYFRGMVRLANQFQFPHHSAKV